ncbi:hypothetical protein [Brevibacillus sp. DP1.3A]|uniref:hypothetical protein n=1 Tax=Brevibacillus sp. DP1.3A TaxID=2738867 RepID=UPI00156B7BB0|nr:hypothetical protein [Brevibacillus sp. DP1.3A]UED77456.1 hypothetical protein HP399_013630 [Brevibacillus sp. DP1.3A]
MENMRDCKLRVGTTSEYRGVASKKKNQIWEVRIKDGKGGNKYLGCFTNKVAATNCFNYHALQDFGEFEAEKEVLK